MASVVQDILTASRVTKIVSRLRTPGNVLSRHLGMNIGGGSVTQVPGNVYTYDLYDNVRSVSRGKLPGAPATAIAPNPVGNNTVTLGRAAEKIAMDYHKVANIRAIGENAGVQDRMGLRYVDKQAFTLNQRQNNFREAFVGALFNGGVLYFTQSGSDLIHSGYSSSGTLFGYDMQFDSNYVLTGGAFAAGLPMDTGSNLVTATWATAATDIPLQLMDISEGFQQGVGEPLSRVYLDATSLLYVLQNDKVRQLAGTSNTSFASHEQTADKAEDGSLTGMIKTVIKGMDWVTFYSSGTRLNLGSAGTTSTKLLPASYATFMIEPTSQWLVGVEGSEVVLESDVASPQEVYGFHSWLMRKADPARFELHTLQNFGIELNVPKGIAWARVR
jgi:hypothetical protein